MRSRARVVVKSLFLRGLEPGSLRPGPLAVGAFILRDNQANIRNVISIHPAVLVSQAFGFGRVEKPNGRSSLVRRALA